MLHKSAPFLLRISTCFKAKAQTQHRYVTFGVKGVILQANSIRFEDSVVIDVCMLVHQLSVSV